MFGPLGPRLSATEGGRRDGKRVSLPLPAATHPKIYYGFALYFLGLFAYVYFNVTKDAQRAWISKEILKKRSPNQFVLSSAPFKLVKTVA